MSRNDTMQRQRARLMEADPHCWYCGIEVTDYGTDGGQQKPDQATLEHLISRRNSWESGRTHSRGPKVLACYECNSTRGGWTSALKNEVAARGRERMRVTIGDFLHFESWSAAR